jgi:hypothetical protein
MGGVETKISDIQIANARVMTPTMCKDHNVIRASFEMLPQHIELSMAGFAFPSRMSLFKKSAKSGSSSFSLS